MLSIPAPYSRCRRDDITVTAVWWEWKDGEVNTTTLNECSEAEGQTLTVEEFFLPGLGLAVDEHTFSVPVLTLLSIQLGHYMGIVIVVNHYVLGKIKWFMSGTKGSTTT